MAVRIWAGADSSSGTGGGVLGDEESGEAAPRVPGRKTRATTTATILIPRAVLTWVMGLFLVP
jgi:hypothetical protein